MEADFEIFSEIICGASAFSATPKKMSLKNKIKDFIKDNKIIESKIVWLQSTGGGNTNIQTVLTAIIYYKTTDEVVNDIDVQPSQAQI